MQSVDSAPANAGDAGSDRRREGVLRQDEQREERNRHSIAAFLLLLLLFGVILVFVGRADSSPFAPRSSAQSPPSFVAT